MPSWRALAHTALLAASLASAAAQADTPAAPVAAKKPKDVSVHGDRRIDDYFWLRDKDHAEVQAHLKAEAAYADAWFKPHAAAEAKLFEEMKGRVQQRDQAVPQRQGAWWYGSRIDVGQQYPVFFRRAAQGPDRLDDPEAPEQVMLDLNELAKTRKFVNLNGMSVSPDDKLLAYGVDATGARDFELHVRDIASGEDRVIATTPHADMFVWAADGKTLFYVRHNEARRSHQLWRHQLGSDKDQLVHEEPDELFNLMLSKSLDGRTLMLGTRSKDTMDWRVLPANRPEAQWREVLPRKVGQEYAVTPFGNELLLRVNDRGVNFRLLRLPLKPGKGALYATKDLARARELIAHRSDAMVEQVAAFKTHAVAQIREGGSVKLRIFPLAGGASREVAFQELAYNAVLAGQREFDAPRVRFAYNSLTTPASTYEADLATGKLELLKVAPVQGGYDASLYASERLWVKAADGTQVPVSLVWRKDKRKNGPQPLLLYGYGSYGHPSDPRFASPRLSLLDRGAIYAIAHIRGGGDLGRQWYLDGKLGKKVNTFTDFVACAEALVAKGYTQPSQLIIHGGSAGGLLVGAATNLRPDLYKAVVAQVPFVDVINTMLDATLPLTTEEYIEWGNPNKAAEYAWMRAYSPYDNLKPVVYPAVLAKTAINDSQVPYWEAAKYVAKLRELNLGKAPVLFDINMTAGHGGASGRFDALRETARTYAFMLQQWGLLE
ncbi:S9 family peptidase [Roseateles asaccharophilus]|uniref:Oligopeptidase B n=1 Tax=Roseateles asaccharophilus TaxID=582607 RepID=A0ABU2A286_9BURK|nr:S9 family peptidase [Roseateles asaccharophilus]MDR7331290.1 oligopeptidase B [Roseateles asaccharophilus]